MIELNNLQKVIDGNTVIDIQGLTVEAGEIAALVGPVGSGKTQLFDLLIGKSQPTAGTISLGGVNPLTEKDRFVAQVGVMFAEDSLYKRQSPLANLVFQCRIRGLPKSRAEEVLVQVGLADHTNAQVEKLSSGLARRLVLGRALLHRPSILLLYDPFAKCDEASIALMSGLLRQLAEEEVTLLILADDTAHLTALCDTIYTFSQGRIVESVDPKEERRAELPFKIPARLEGKVALVNPADILYAEAEESRAYLHTKEGRLPTQFTLGELEERLARSGFFRAHRAYLVNLQRVKEVIPYTRNSFSLKLDDEPNTEIPLSKTAAKELRELLDY